MTHMVQLRDVRKQLDGFQWGPIDLKLDEGYIIAVVGPNGSGKSTLFRMLMNMVKPDEGIVQLFGERYEASEIAIKRRIGYLPEWRPYEEMNFTLKGLKQFIAPLYPEWDEQKYQKLLETFSLQENAQLSKLSKGIKQKLALLLSLSVSPDLLLLDEPSSGLDPLAWRLMLEEIHHYMQDGRKTVVIATHVMDEVKRLADYIVFMYEGQMLGYYEKDALLDQWKTIWLDHPPAALPHAEGIVHYEPGSGKLITHHAEQTMVDLQRQGIIATRVQAMELEDIFMYLVSMKKAKVVS